MINIIQPIVDKSEFSLEELQSDCRKPRLTIVRHLLFLHLRNMKDKDNKPLYSFEEIGKAFNRNHSTVIHGVNQINRLIKRSNGVVIYYVHKLGLNVHLVIAK